MSNKKITNKYCINEEVWFMDENKPIMGFVDCINLEDKDTIMYTINNTGDLYSESQLFKTKQELLDSL